ncbi:MAG: hypothetical protein ABI718_13760 [Acidobacteriota bacterium]
MILDAILAVLREPSNAGALKQLAAIPPHPAQIPSRALVARIEDEVAADPARHFTFDHDGRATLNTSTHQLSAGNFETPSIAELRSRIEGPGSAKATLRLSVLLGRSPFTDVATLQAHASERSIFQVASQFNCLESPGAHRIVPVREYFDDPTQGPRASIAAFPATLLRHYQARRSDGSRFTQKTNGEQIDLLADACGGRVTRNGYLTGENLDPERLLQSLTTNFHQIRLGVHSEVEPAASGAGLRGDARPHAASTITQIFTSTVAGGSYGGDRHLGGHFPEISRQLLRAAYLGTFLAAVSLPRACVVATLVGGGVFRNDLAEIWNAITWAAAEIEPLMTDDLDIIVNAHTSLTVAPPSLRDQILDDVRTRTGTMLKFDGAAPPSVLSM